MVFGGVCPSVTSIIAESLQGWNLVQVKSKLLLLGQTVLVGNHKLCLGMVPHMITRLLG